MHKIRKGWCDYIIAFNFHVIINELKVFLDSKTGNILFCLQEVILWDILVHSSFVCCVLCWPCCTWYWVSNLTLQLSSPNIHIQILPTDLHTFPSRIDWGEGGGQDSIASHQWARVKIRASMPYVGWVCCWFSPLLWEVFLWVLRFSPLLPPKTKMNFNSSVIWSEFSNVFVFFF